MKKMLLAMAGILLSGTGQADVLSGSLWHVPEEIAQNAIPANISARTPDVTFDVSPPLNFGTVNLGEGNTVGTWLASGGASNIVEKTPGTLDSLMDTSIEGCSTDCRGVASLLEFSGLVNVTNGQPFTVTHDDGATLTIGGLNLVFSPTPSYPTSSTVTYTGPSGVLPFQLVYAECCGGPAVLQVTSVVPEPQTYMMLLAGLGLLGSISMRCRRKTR